MNTAIPGYTRTRTKTRKESKSDVILYPYPHLYGDSLWFKRMPYYRPHYPISNFIGSLFLPHVRLKDDGTKKL